MSQCYKVPSLLREALVNDEYEVTCQECDLLVTVDGCRDIKEDVRDSFNGSWNQSSSSYEVFITEFICPECKTHNKIEVELE